MQTMNSFQSRMFIVPVVCFFFCFAIKDVKCLPYAPSSAFYICQKTVKKDVFVQVYQFGIGPT